MIKNERQWLLKQCFDTQTRWASLFGVRLAVLSLKSQTALRPTHLSASQKPCQVLATTSFPVWRVCLAQPNTVLVWTSREALEKQESRSAGM